MHRPSRVQEKRDAARIQARERVRFSGGSPIDPRTARLSTMGAIVLSIGGSPIAFALLSVEVPPKAASADPPRELKAEAAIPDDENPGTARRSGDGLFYVKLRANGTRLRCLVDTGASDLVLSSEQAEGVGIPPDDVDYDHHIATAGGMRAAARTILKSVDVAGHHFERVPLVLVKGGRTPCLMGQNLLARLDAVEIHADELRLR